VKAAPQTEEPERYLFWGAAGQFVDFLAKASGWQGWEPAGCVGVWECKCWRAGALPHGWVGG